MTGTTGVAIESRILSEAWGPGAWHGADLKAAIADVTPVLAFWRPAKGRHNIAEIALHHAFFVRSVRSQISGQPAEPFVLPGEEWFVVNDEKTLPWVRIQSALESEQQRLAELMASVETVTTSSPLAATERFNLVLGIACHAIYHAGQVQLIKRLRAA
ncbi:MAG: DinB family protein [Gemmatimonadota bacterium]